MACWDDDEALDRFLDEHPVAQSLAGGWHVRLEPLRAVGSYTAFASLPTEERPVHDEEPVVVLTYGRMKLRRAVPFLRANSPAAGLASEQPAMLAGTGLARPPRIVSTFSVWRTAREMRAYALGKVGRGHTDAARKHNHAPSTTRQCSPVSSVRSRGAVGRSRAAGGGGGAGGHLRRALGGLRAPFPSTPSRNRLR